MKRFLLILAFAFAVFAGALSWNAYTARTRGLADADQMLVARAQFYAHALDRTLQARMIQTFTFAALPSLRAFAASDPVARQDRMPVARVELFALAEADPDIRAATIVDANGFVILATDGTMAANWSQRVFVREALRGQLHGSVPAREREPVQYYSAPLLNNAGEVAGALVLRVTAQELWDVIGASAGVIVVDELGVRLADNSAVSQLFVALAPVPADALATALVEQRYGAATTTIRATALSDLASVVARNLAAQPVYRDAAGQTFRAATRRIVTNPWTVIAFEREDVLLAPVGDALRDQVGVAIVTALVVAAAMSAAQIWLDEKKP